MRFSLSKSTASLVAFTGPTEPELRYVAYEPMLAHDSNNDAESLLNVTFAEPHAFRLL